MKFYRITSKGRGIYEAVDVDCPRDTCDKRKNKPDGSWLPKKGVHYPGAISYWTEFGMKKYEESGLFAWHTDAVNGEVDIETLETKPEEVLYEDEYQIIFMKLP